MTTFRTDQVDNNRVNIKRTPNTLAGSIARVDDHWHVEIMWSGPGGAITYEAPSLPLALAFMDGVDAAFDRVLMLGEY
ncbi:hypothetical protein I6F35_10060 [Bradyrhizobium sp. BRP22]|uniref:hypothetical protein n=1 Tax=Bradyrhizobium sp. BRP22 TaxID=2793821 RepID=UPI001CD3081E|nr:hypothetical protein [Bradyrhizobium sp. BRP22]MCA1453556.1 hypothetical protein [Bradyrhizobium sp. BRP22]